MPINEIPERIGFLILLFLHKQLSDIQRKELDRWILQDVEHELLFDEAINEKILKNNKKEKKPTSRQLKKMQETARVEKTIK